MGEMVCGLCVWIFDREHHCDVVVERAVVDYWAQTIDIYLHGKFSTCMLMISWGCFKSCEFMNMNR